MKKISKVADVFVLIAACWFVISAVVHGTNGESLEMRMDLLWSVLCIMNLRISTLHSVYESLDEVVGGMLELIGLILKVNDGKEGKRDVE